MQVCRYVGIRYVCMHAYMHTCMHACMYACMYVCMYVCILNTHTHTHTQGVGSLDPLLRSLLSAPSDDDLSKNIRDLFMRLDIDGSGAIGLFGI